MDQKLKDLLKEFGISTNQWNETVEKTTHLPFIKPQIENLLKLRSHLEGLVNADTERMAALQEQIIRMQRGGGR